jgi:hypothetical protein
MRMFLSHFVNVFLMVDNDIQPVADVSDDAVEQEFDEVSEQEFDSLLGIVIDGFIGAIGGLVGSTALTVILLIGSSIGAFDFHSFIELAGFTGAAELFPWNPVTVGFIAFFASGMVMWPLLFASIGTYLPGEKYATKGLSFGFVLWTGFVLMFYTGTTGIQFILYIVLTLLGHFAYGFSLGAVFDYLSNRPQTLV